MWKVLPRIQTHIIACVAPETVCYMRESSIEEFVKMREHSNKRVGIPHGIKFGRRVTAVPSPSELCPPPRLNFASASEFEYPKS